MLLARDIMTRDVVTVAPDTPVEAITRLMLDKHLDAIPVADASGQPVGLVNQEHLITRLASPGRLITRLTHDDPLDVLEEARAQMNRAMGKTAADEMRTDINLVNGDMPVSELVEIFLDRHVALILVQEAGRMAGVISKRDVMRAMVDAPVRGPAQA